jgi:hydroxymethylpyrimidine/phosphomethylpyrimidine kinase
LLKNKREMMNNRYKSVLSIAGSDSGGCAGIQADIKSISANGGFASTVITATTAQNTQGVTDIHGIPPLHIKKQLEAVLSDIEFGAVKIGMLHSAEVIETVKNCLLHYKVKNIILDPVMVATSGDTLISKKGIKSLRSFFPHTSLITPNIPEGEILLGESISLKNIELSAKKISDKFETSVLLKGGHLDFKDEMTDVLFLKDEQRVVVINNKAIDTKHTHGTGCSLSSAIATFISLGFSLEESVIKGCNYLNQAIWDGKDKVLGKGNGPINHFGV